MTELERVEFCFIENGKRLSQEGNISVYIYFIAPKHKIMKVIFQ